MKNNNLKVKIPGKKGAIARLIVLALFAVIGVVASVGTLGTYIPKRGLWQAILDAFSGCGLIFLVGALAVALMAFLDIMKLCRRPSDT